MNNIRIVSWNTRGNVELNAIIAYFDAEDWDLIFVLEPSVLMLKEYQSGIYAKFMKENGIRLGHITTTGSKKPEKIFYIYNEKRITNIRFSSKDILVGANSALMLEIKTPGGKFYKILSCHAIWGNGKEDSADYQNSILKIGKQESVDLIIGDLNTGGNALGSRTRSNGSYSLLQNPGTSRASNPLDKIFISKENDSLRHGKYDLKDFEPIDIKRRNVIVSNTTRVLRDKTKNSSDKNQPDHCPIYVDLPYVQVSKKKVSGKRNSSCDPNSIRKDGNCLYRCVAQHIYGDQNLYLRVRTELANYFRNHYGQYGMIDFLQNRNDRNLYVINLETTNSWGGELEILGLANCYNLKIRLISSETFDGAEYGNPNTNNNLIIYHQDYHYFL
ncbi:OTU domain-containing protein [Marinoscillum furvescens]|uniref:OTU-like cysteine protease n=1 Tax=Marinoscillum furvescens DSM 4134 TaxID=1122208 RepID=A0A3D9L891_MARFU|nr:OTU domain-containing protein [Marinoscillum furvescens]REE01723.1 OTU-like cysteine protease [Marinoscillum furvescens DSM 4134]